MEHPVVDRRLLPLVACGALLVHLLTVTGPFVAYYGWDCFRRASLARVDLSVALYSIWPYADGLLNIRIWRTQSTVLTKLMDPWALWAWAWWVVMPFTFLLLPRTLRQCRVRTQHIRRIGAYSIVHAAMSVLLAVQSLNLTSNVIQTVFGAWTGSPWAGAISSTKYDSLMQRLLFLERPMSVVGSAFLVWLFWGFAAQRYLRLPRPWLVALVMSVLSAALSLGLLCLMPWYWHPFVERLSERRTW